jgi:F0F1-type ATP synthase alpha subunit
MSNVNHLVKKAVDQHNEARERSTENMVTDLVQKIIKTESDIKRMQAEVVEMKKTLKDLEMPTPVSLEL